MTYRNDRPAARRNGATAAPARTGSVLATQFAALMVLLVALGALGGCAGTPEARAETTPAGDRFETWIRAFKTEARGEGISQATLDRAFKGVRYNERVMELDAHQPEFVQPVGRYVNARTTPETLARGRELREQHRALLDRIEREYGVQPHYILAIWRLETDYGRNFGSFNVVEALATLAFDGRRKTFWREELVAALRIIQRGDIPADRMVGSWAGAMGHTQFIPSSYLAYAVDGDGDGRRDLWNSLPDVFASTANYLAKAGWTRGQPFGVEVTLPENFAFEQAAPDNWRPAAEWLRLGVTKADGTPLADDLRSAQASILLPSGHRGPAFMVFGNYRSILRYNNAAAYALAVGILAERLDGTPPVRRPWPLDDRLLSRGEKEELQQLLGRLGFDPGPVDGKVGPMTQAAIRSFQRSAGVPADAYANFELLDLARRRAGR